MRLTNRMCSAAWNSLISEGYELKIGRISGVTGDLPGGSNGKNLLNAESRFDPRSGIPWRRDMTPSVFCSLSGLESMGSKELGMTEQQYATFAANEKGGAECQE